ncbi:MAG TPA: hypothetical protein EYG86_02735 [Crocinitomicaceae bacterium]|nr:hypothetical protein [Crocinitomicaceae bacterium]
MNRLFIIITLVSLISCKSEVKILVDDVDILADSIPEITEPDALDSIIVSDYDMSDVDRKDVKEFKENLVKIEKEYGEQWDFCLCVVKGDSINKAFMNPDISDDKFNKLSDRFDVIDEKCKAFRIQNPSITPAERAAHEKKVRTCLKEAGIK